MTTIEQLAAAQEKTSKALDAAVELIESLQTRLDDAEKKGKAGGGGNNGDLAERLVNVEHLLGVKLPLRSIPGLEHKSSLPPDATHEGRMALEEKEKLEREKKRTTQRV